MDVTPPRREASEHMEDAGRTIEPGDGPVFKSPLHVGRPNVGDRVTFMARVEDALDRVWLTNDGPYVRELAYSGRSRSPIPLEADQ